MRTGFRLFAGGIACLLAVAALPGLAAPSAPPVQGLTAEERARFAEGQEAFRMRFLPPDGLGPRSNDISCESCHRQPVTGGDGNTYNAILHHGVDLRPAMQSDSPWAQLAALLGGGNGFLPTGVGGKSLLRTQHTDEIAAEVIPEQATAISLRKPADLRGVGLIARIPNGQILGNQRRQERHHPEMAGRAVREGGGRVARFGSQLHLPTDLVALVRKAFDEEIGLTLAEQRGVRMPSGATIDVAVADFLRFIGPPPSQPTNWAPGGVASPSSPAVKRGRALFDELACSVCHVPRYELPDGTVVEPYSDFLLHDLGRPLDDGVPLGQARAGEWRTTPLWGVRDRVPRLIHDLRGASIEIAIYWHGGQAAASRAAFQRLPLHERRDLVRFLDSLRTRGY